MAQVSYWRRAERLRESVLRFCSCRFLASGSKSSNQLADGWMIVPELASNRETATHNFKISSLRKLYFGHVYPLYYLRVSILCFQRLAASKTASRKMTMADIQIWR